MEKYMHRFVPPRLFKATVRLKDPSSPSCCSTSISSSGFVSGMDSVDSMAWIDQRTSSIPSSPTSRARILSRSSQNVSSVMFQARDVLRVEVLASSEDSISREIACQSLRNKTLPQFDDRKKVDGLLLTCGNHCASKLGASLCCTIQSMLPVHPNAYIYFEFSVLSAMGVAPCISLGLGANHIPGNALVGSCLHSIGLYSDGQLLVEGQWVPESPSQAITPGATVGVLAYVSRPSLLTNNLNDPPNPSSIVFNINGKCSRFPLSQEAVQEFFALQDLVLYPTISILSERTNVWCRFCEADVVASSREYIGAPSDQRIYCLDGSVLFE